MKFLLVLFSGVTLVGLFILLIGFVGSHGHFQFRSHMTEDWIILGTPLLGISGIVFVTLKIIKDSKN
jgi:uncharacterized membrane protein